MAKTIEFTGYKWAGLSSLPEGSFWHRRAQSFLASVDWKALCDYASSLHNGEKCELEPAITLGGHYMVRIIQFEDNSRWIARLRMPGRDTDEGDNINGRKVVDDLLKSEFDCLQLVKERTTVPVSTVFGSIIRLENGGYDVSPILGLGGPFNTATEYFRAWGAAMRFPHPASFIESSCGELGAEVAKLIVEFPRRISELAEMLPVRDNGPFPLCHIDFGHNNILVDDHHKVLGVIDWEHAFAAPWEVVDFPLTLSTIPEAMDAPWNYENGVPRDEKTRERLVERKAYIAAVSRAEDPSEPRLSSILSNQKVQDLAIAMRLYAIDGKMGLYSRILDVHYSPKVDI